MAAVGVDEVPDRCGCHGFDLVGDGQDTRWPASNRDEDRRLAGNQSDATSGMILMSGIFSKPRIVDT